MVSSRRIRFTSLFIALMAALAVTLLAPGAFGAVYTATFTVDPSDAIKGHVITSDPLNDTGPNVAVQVSSPSEDPVGGLTVTLEFAEGSATTTNISGNVETTDADTGVATFDELTIGKANEPTFTDYQFEAVVSAPIVPLGAALAATPPLSEPFDIWDAGCASPCTGNLKNNTQSYKATDGLLTLTDVSPDDLPNLECPGQTLVLDEHIFSHATTGDDAVFVTSRISKVEMKAAANNGQVFVKWCVGLKDPAAWEHNGAAFDRQDTNGDGTDDLYVAFAPKCPKTNQASFAPCIVKQKADPAGGNVTTGWLPGGDPPRRT